MAAVRAPCPWCLGGLVVVERTSWDTPLGQRGGCWVDEPVQCSAGCALHPEDVQRLLLRVLERPEGACVPAADPVVAGGGEMSWRGWATYAWGFLAGAVVASYVALSCGPTQAQSQEVAYALDHAADTYGVSRRCLWNVARRESRFRPWVDNAQGSGAAGLMQFKDGTWRFMSWAAGYGGASVYDAWAAAHVAAWAIANPEPSQGGLRHWGGWC